MPIQKKILLFNSLPVNQLSGAGTGTKRKFGEGPVEDPRVQLLAAAMQGTVNLSSRRVRLDFSPKADKLTLLPPPSDRENSVLLVARFCSLACREHNHPDLPCILFTPNFP